MLCLLAYCEDEHPENRISSQANNARPIVLHMMLYNVLEAFLRWSTANWCAEPKTSADSLWKQLDTKDTNDHDLASNSHQGVTPKERDSSDCQCPTPNSLKLVFLIEIQTFT